MRAVIDIGSNSCRLLLAETENGRVIPAVKEAVITRLGGGAARLGFLSAAGIERTLAALDTFKKQIPPHIPTGVLATSAVRTAANKEEFIKLVQKKTGWPVEVLSGSKEARLSFLGAAATLPAGLLLDPCCVIDVGGGSTEIYTGSAAGELLGGGSLEIGAVRLLEHFISGHPVSGRERKRLEKVIRGQLKPLVEKNRKLGPRTLAAVGGTALTAAALNRNMAVFDEEYLNGEKLLLTEIEETYAKLADMTLKERRGLKALQPGREDVIVSGICLLWQAVSLLGFSEILISVGDLLSGYLLSAVDGGR